MRHFSAFATEMSARFDFQIRNILTDTLLFLQHEGLFALYAMSQLLLAFQIRKNINQRWTMSHFYIEDMRASKK